MAILIQNHKLTPDQYLKLFSNPVSGIACDMNGAGTNYDYAHGGRFYLKNIRYSKSMIVDAIDFWFNYFYNICKKMKRIYNPLINYSEYIWKQVEELTVLWNRVKQMPDTFLFSHRHIHSIQTKHSKSMDVQLKLLYDKYTDLFQQSRFYGFQEQTLQPFFNFAILNNSIIFSVFPNEHPYIERQKISRVGMTEKGNVYIMMSKDGAHKK